MRGGRAGEAGSSMSRAGSAMLPVQGGNGLMQRASSANLAGLVHNGGYGHPPSNRKHLHDSVDVLNGLHFSHMH